MARSVGSGSAGNNQAEDASEKAPPLAGFREIILGNAECIA